MNKIQWINDEILSLWMMTIVSVRYIFQHTKNSLSKMCTQFSKKYTNTMKRWLIMPLSGRSHSPRPGCCETHQLMFKANVGSSPDLASREPLSSRQESIPSAQPSQQSLLTSNHEDEGWQTSPVDLLTTDELAESKKNVLKNILETMKLSFILLRASEIQPRWR